MTITSPSQPLTAQRISAPGTYGEIVDFLIDEAALLDDCRDREWYELLTDDVVYEMPARRTVYRERGDGFSEHGAYFDDDKISMGARINRNADSEYAYDRDPLPRTRRLITNVVVYEHTNADEYQVTSSLLLLRTRLSQGVYDQISARRADIIRRTPEGMRLARRTVYLDLTFPGANFMNVVL